MRKSQRGNRVLRAIDAIVGVPIVVALAVTRSQSKRPTAPKTIGIMVLGALGDVLLASSVLGAVREAFPKSRILVFCSPSNRPAFDLIVGFDHLIEISLSNPLRAILQVRNEPLDCLIDTSQWSRFGAILSALSSATYTIGFQTQGQNRHFAYDARVPHHANRHEIENFQALGEPLGLSVKVLPSLNLAVIEGYVFDPQEPLFVVFHPWASGTNAGMREWPLDHWSNLAITVIQSGYDVMLSSGPEDQTKSSQLVKFISMRFPEFGELIALKVRIVQSKSLVQTAAILHRAAAIVSVNTGIMHLAALLDRPLVALHGPTNSMRWGPQYPGMHFAIPPAVLAVPAEEGGAFLNLGFEYGRNHQYVMQRISVMQVIEALRRLRIPIQSV